ncbi:hypothetical protein PRZ48_001189 [Zasmidium cellare]|uniref:SET domain-containing protein n=1 Tax=Zasmidium cellare TaxID=395010 RepID=A0ABR0F0K9_ZASCE|nr:hypothetical protein PRZ48_001189 [Zasmidium cellare]
MPLRCSSFAADQWFSGLPSASAILLGPPAVEVRSSGEGRGLGLFAVRDIPTFSQILSDGPLILMKPGEDLPELYQQFKGLSKNDQEVYLSLSAHDNPARDALLKDKLLQRGFDKDELEQMAKVAGIMQTNAFNVNMQDGQGSCHRALFPNVARINHSCAPNAHVCFYSPNDHNPRGRMVIHTLKSLQPGEEVLISYFNILLPQSERQQKARKWGFECRCPVCDEDSSEHNRFEQQRKTCRDFTTRQETLMQSNTATMKAINSLLEKGRELAAEAEECPELFPAIPDLYDGIGMLRAKALMLQKRETQRQDLVLDLERSVIWDARITGKDSPATQRRLQKVVQFAARKGSKASPRIDRDEVVTGSKILRKIRIRKQALSISVKIAEDKIAKHKIAKDEIAKDEIAKDEIAKDEIAKDRTAKDAIAKDKIAKGKLAKDKSPGVSGSSWQPVRTTIICLGTEVGPKIDKITIVWLCIVIAVVTVGIIIAFVVLGRRFCCTRSTKRKNKKINYLDNRISFGAWNGDSLLELNAEKSARQSKAYAAPRERAWEIAIPPVMVVDQTPQSSGRGKYVKVGSVR